MRNTLATLALAALPALVLSACNGGAGSSGTTTLPNTGAAPASHQGRMHHNDNGPQDLHAGGATFPAYGYNLGNQPAGLYSAPQAPPGEGSLFYAAPTKGTVYYCLTGSGFGRSEFIDNNGTATAACQPLGASPSGFGGRQDPLDFVGSDVAMKSTEYTTYKANRECSPSSPPSCVSWGEPFEFPTIGGPIVYGYRPKDLDVKKVQISTWSLCAVANGTISDWNDPALTADNKGKSLTGGTSQTITFYFRSDSSGTSNIFTNYLNTACNVTFGSPYNKPPYGSASRSAAWTFGVNSTWPGPGSSGDPNPRFIGESGNPGVLAGIQSTPYGTGYLEGAWAASANPPVGQMLAQNGSKGRKHKAVFVDPTNKKALELSFSGLGAGSIDYGGGSDGSPLGSSTPWCQLYIPLNAIVTTPPKSYPIVGFSYWLFYGNNNGVHVSDKTTLVNYLTSSSANTLISKLEYVAMPNSIHTAITDALTGTGGGSGSGHPCLQ